MSGVRSTGGEVGDRGALARPVEVLLEGGDLGTGVGVVIRPEQLAQRRPGSGGDPADDRLGAPLRVTQLASLQREVVAHHLAHGRVDVDGGFRQRQRVLRQEEGAAVPGLHERDVDAEVGDLTVEYETLTLPGDPGTTLFVYTTEPDSPSRRAMSLLAS